MSISQERSSHRIAWSLLVPLFFCYLPEAHARTFSAGSLIIPMDLVYQDRGMLQSYGLVHRLLAEGIPVFRVIDPSQTSSAECDTSAEGCWWDCVTEGSGVDCPYPTFSPSLVESARVVWDDRGALPAGTLVPRHGYRGGPFIVPYSHSFLALDIIDAWNRPETWDLFPWMERPAFSVVSVHQTVSSVSLLYEVELTRPPRVAVLADSREARFTRVLRAAGIRQSNGEAFPEGLCAPGQCGPGTANPDLLPPEVLLTRWEGCVRDLRPDLPSVLLDLHGRPRYGMLAAAGWDVDRRERIVCGEGACTTTLVADGTGLLACFDAPIREHGHQLLQHLKYFHELGGSLFLVGEAVYAVENAVRRPAPPYLDQVEPGHYLTSRAELAPCPCLAGASCVPEACIGLDDQPVACCIPDEPRARGAGVAPGGTPLGALTVSHPWYPQFLFDGDFRPTLGQLGALSLRIPGAWSSLQPQTASVSRGDAYLALAGQRTTLLADVDPAVAVPLSANPDSQAARIFLDALFFSGLYPSSDQEGVRMEFVSEPPCTLDPRPVPSTGVLRVSALYALELDFVDLEVRLPPGVSSFECDPAPTGPAPFLRWRWERVPGELELPCAMTFTRAGAFPIAFTLRYEDGGEAGTLEQVATVYAGPFPDGDEDGIPDCLDSYPWGPNPCGDGDGDGYDDCTGENVSDDDCCDEGGRKYYPRHGLCPATVGGRTHVPRSPAWLLLLMLVFLRRRPR